MNHPLSQNKPQQLATFICVPILLQDLLQPDQKKAVNAAYGFLRGRRPAGSIANWEFYSGNHWQNGNGWIGAKPLLGCDGYTQTMKQIEQAFVSENVIKEVVDRHGGGILGREPLWGFVPQSTVRESTNSRRRRFAKLFNSIFQALTGTSINARAQEADEALTIWWDLAKPRKQLKESLKRCLNEDRAVLRLFVPRGLYNKDKEIPVQPTLTDALSLLHIDVVSADKGAVLIDSDTQKPFAIYAYQIDRAKCVELSYVNDRGETVLQILSEKPELQVEPIPYQLQGRLWMHEIERSALITEQIRSEQKCLNLAKTSMMRNVNLAGNLERIIMNAERPKKKVTVTDPNSPTGFREETTDGQFLLGAGVTNVLTGLLIRNDKGEIIGRANPNISYRDPVPIETFVGTRKECRESILAQAQQLHVMMSGDATASGWSRETSRGEYRASLNDSKEPVDDAGRWILETPLRLAAVFCDRVKDFEDLRCDFDARIEDGPVSSEERAANRADVTAGLLSRETAMSRNGTEDTDAEKARIREDQATAPPPVIPPPTDLPSDGREMIQ